MLRLMMMMMMMMRRGPSILLALLILTIALSITLTLALTIALCTRFSRGVVFLLFDIGAATGAGAATLCSRALCGSGGRRVSAARGRGGVPRDRRLGSRGGLFVLARRRPHIIRARRRALGCVTISSTMLRRRRRILAQRGATRAMCGAGVRVSAG